MFGQVSADPYLWPFDVSLRSDNTALLIIDMQADFLSRGGCVDQMGYDLSLTRKAIGPIKALLDVCRQKGFRIIHTREGHRPDLSDLPARKRFRSANSGAEFGSKGPLGRVLIRGEQGWDIIEELQPLPGEAVVDKPGYGAFYATDLELILRTARVQNLILTGITTDVCVHSTMRDAADRGFDCLLLSDCTGATVEANHEAAFSMVKQEGGVFGAVATSADVLAVLQSPQPATEHAAVPTST
ncbi:hypothetical protein WJX72_007050 [[Myrmecia] bisecta]|uniref:Isochorismatase-like domain-containing protein n=1 Tax=[Myrmecia] bisecta TaxID=41462 RepID=A0AAW1PYR6_9CHLO